MLTRRLARPLLASWFVATGLDACRRPDEHVERTRDAWHRLAARVDGLPETPSDEVLRKAARAHGAATAIAGLLLALGKAPRFAACALAALTAPVAVLDAPVKARRTSSHSPASHPHLAAAQTTERAFVRDLSLIGGALLAGLDTEGRPSVAWRVQHARETTPTS